MSKKLLRNIYSHRPYSVPSYLTIVINICIEEKYSEHPWKH
jgi:hypothetical protein